MIALGFTRIEATTGFGCSPTGVCQSRTCTVEYVRNSFYVGTATFQANLTKGSHIFHSNHSRYRMDLTTTTIQVEERTRQELFRIVTELEREKGRRVTYDEAIMVLIERAKLRNAARARFRSLYGTLGPDSGAWVELRKLRKGEKARLERIVEASR